MRFPRNGHRFQVVTILVVLSLIAGCTGPPLDDEIVASEKDDRIRLVEGWSHTEPGGQFRYENGYLHGNYQGDQLVLRINNTELLELGPMNGTLKGRQPAESDFVRVLAVWNEKDPWPQHPGYYFFGMSGRSDAIVNSNVMGHQVRESIDYDLGLGSERSYTLILNFTKTLHLPPGNWLLWFAVGESPEMEVEIELPEGLPLSGPPRFSRGCGSVHGTDYESETFLYAKAITVIENARWRIALPEDSILLGSTFAGTGFVPAWAMPGGHWDHRFLLPNGTIRDFYWSVGEQRADPPDWDGTLLTSMTPGEHVFEIVSERSSSSEPIAYCVL